VAKYVEIVPPPAEVDLVFYESPTKTPHIAVAPASHHEDTLVVGVTMTGLEKQLTNVRAGDAVITYPDGTIVVKSREEALSYFAPKRVRADKPKIPALPEKIEEVDLDELLKETE